MKKLLVVGIIILMVGMSVPSTGFNVEKSTASFDGNTLYVGGDGPGNYSTIQDAIDNANNGDTVYVYNGTYYEIVVLDKSLNLFGEDKNNTVINSKHTGDVISITVGSTTISGFHILNGGNYGLYLAESDNNEIINNKITNSNGGIELYYSNHNEIHSNIICDNAEEGIYLYCSHQNSIFENYIYRQGEGIELIRSDGNHISYNSIFNHNYNPYEDWAKGIFISGSNSNNVVYNKLYNNEIGISIEYSNENNVSQNELSNVSWSIILEDSLSNAINNNNLFESKIWFLIHFFSEGSICWTNNWNNNYWEKARILPKPIFGYISYFKVPWINFDWHPAKEPFDIGV